MCSSICFKSIFILYQVIHFEPFWDPLQIVNRNKNLTQEKKNIENSIHKKYKNYRSEAVWWNIGNSEQTGGHTGARQGHKHFLSIRCAP